MKRRELLSDCFSLCTVMAFLCVTSSANAETRVPSKPTKQKSLDDFVLYSNIDKEKSPIDRFAEGLRASVLAGKIFKIDEDVKFAGTVQVPASARVEGSDKWIIQEKALTPLFQCDGPGARVFKNINCKGVGADYINSSAVYAAACVVARNGASVVVENCQLVNFAGAGVKLMAGAVNCKIIRSKISGPGKNYITSKSNNYGACVVVDNGVKKWVIDECDLSLSAQGIVTGDDLVDVQITGNRIHDIAGQHGAYIESVRNIEISRNVFFNIPLQAIKIQIGSAHAANAERILIENNKISNVGSHGILLTNPVGSNARLQNFVIRGNTFEDVGESAISLNSCDDGLIESNEIRSVARGLYVNSCSALNVVKNVIRDATKEGALGVNVKHTSFRENYFYKNSASATGGGVGISFSGASTEGIDIALNKMEGAISKRILTEKISASQFRLQGNNFNFPEK